LVLFALQEDVMSASQTFDALAADASDHDAERRTMVMLTVGVTAAGTVATAIPLVSSFAPSRRALAAGASVEADISDLAAAAMKTVEWRG
jgi:ubiquinol-cytochrome c reductase iron-sulfur subunit